LMPTKIFYMQTEPICKITLLLKAWMFINFIRYPMVLHNL
jgi:hypothetical protein